jgi:DNA-binding beta-propeller fold protein YncE
MNSCCPTKSLFLLLALSVSVGVNGLSQTLRFGPPIPISGGFAHPYGLAVDAVNGRLLVADTGNNRFKWAKIADLAGSYMFSESGYIPDRTDPDSLTDPQAIAADSQGNVYVANTLAGNVRLYLWDSGSYKISAVFCKTTPHTVAGLDIQMPRDIAVASDGAVYLLDSGNKRILKADGPNATVWTVFKSDNAWNNPYGIAVDATGNFFVADTGNHRVI